MKIREVYLLSDAVQDLEEGRHFYNEKEDGVGEYFFDSLISDLESLQFYAGIHSKKIDFYRALSKRFPFAIYYEIKKDIVMVVAILDMRRAPAWIREKLKKVKS